MEKQKNSEESLIVCKCCGRTFNSYTGLWAHLRKNNLNYIRVYDLDEFLDSEEIENLLNS